LRRPRFCLLLGQPGVTVERVSSWAWAREPDIMQVAILEGGLVFSNLVCAFISSYSRMGLDFVEMYGIL
jgi:hypothetical protein